MFYPQERRSLVTSYDRLCETSAHCATQGERTKLPLRIPTELNPTIYNQRDNTCCVWVAPECVSRRACEVCETPQVTGPIRSITPYPQERTHNMLLMGRWHILRGECMAETAQQNKAQEEGRRRAICEAAQPCDIRATPLNPLAASLN